MGILLLIGFSQVALSVWFTYKEVMRFYSFIKMEVEDTHKWKITLPFRCIKHLPKALPILADIFLAVFLSSFMGFGAGVVGGVTGMFASNCMSAIIYYHTHIKHKKEVVIA